MRDVGSLDRLDAPELNGATCIITETGYFFKKRAIFMLRNGLRA